MTPTNYGRAFYQNAQAAKAERLPGSDIITVVCPVCERRVIRLRLTANPKKGWDVLSACNDFFSNRMEALGY